MGCSTSSAEEGKSRFLQRYDVAAKLGEGSFGEVRAITPKAVGSAGCDVSLAVKIVRVGAKLEHTDVIHEQQLWQMVGDHKHCVRLLGSFAEAQAYYFVMDRCDLPLTDVWKMSAPCDVELARVFREMSLGVAHLHSLRMVHRDIKPSNFLQGGENGFTIKLCDFGLSAVLPDSGCLLFDVCGTTSYMSPELLEGKGYCEKTDVWSLGATSYRLLFGEDPYRHSLDDSTATNSAKIRALEAAILIDCPKPSFSPCGGKAAGAPQAAGAGFVRWLLTRAPAERSSAAQALRHPLFRKGAEQRASASWTPRESRASAEFSETTGEASCSTVSPANSTDSASSSDGSSRLASGGCV